MDERSPYRQGPAIPKPEPRPVERLVVSRYGVYPAIAIVLASIALVVFIAYGAYGRTRLVCTRSAPSATPSCIGEQSGFGAHDVPAFELRPTTVQATKRSSDDETYHVITTPNGELGRAVDEDFANATAAGAKRFAETPSELRFEAVHTKSSASTGYAIGGLVFVGIILLIMKRTHIEIDRDAGIVRTGKLGGHRLVEIDTAEVESIDDSAFYKVLLVMKDGSRAVIADGRESECNALAEAVKRAVRELAPPPRKNPPPVIEAEPVPEGPPPGEAVLLDALVRIMPIDPSGITHDRELDSVEARGTWRGVDVIASADAREPNGITFAVERSTELPLLELHLDEDAKPEEESDRVFFGDGIFTDDEEEAAVLRAMPAALRERVIGAMRTARIRTVGVYSDETIVEGIEGGDVSAMLDLLVEIAEWASTAKT